MDFLLQPPSSRIHRREDNKAGYVTPPLDGSLTVSELYDFHYEHNPDHPVFVFAGSEGLTHLTFHQLVPAAHNAARFVARAIGLDLEGPNLTHPRPTVAILAETDTITYFTTVLGMLRAEIIVFPIFSENSVAAVAHLLKITHASHILVSSELSIQELAKNALFAMDPADAPQMCPMPAYEDISTSGSRFSPLPPRRKDYTVTRIIAHSSGSTALPKPVYWNDRLYLQISLAPLYGTHDFCGQVFGGHVVQMPDCLGLSFIAWVPTTGLIMATFPPVSPAVTVTKVSTWRGFLDTNPSYIYCWPVYYELWSSDPSKLPFLKGLKGIIFSGAPLAKATGDHLAREGVAIYTLYGSTEVSPYVKFFPDHPGLDWEYFHLNPQCAMEFLPLGDGTYELIIVARRTTELPVINTTFEGEPAFATNDCLAPHPTQPGKWKVLGRLDNQIINSGGDKINPGPFETILCQHPHVSAAVMFGAGKPGSGVLFELKEEHYFDPADSDRLGEFRNSIQPQLEAANGFTVQGHRVHKEMIIVAHSSKPFIFNKKGLPKRPTIWVNYSDEIEVLYSGLGTN